MRILLFILSLLFCVSVDAQKLTVESFAEKTNDLAARTNERVDYNKVPCALIKVQLASPGAVFEGNVMGDVAYKTSEYWVYMSKGSKRLTVKLEGYLPLLVEFPEPLNSSVTYVLTISGVMNSAALQQEVRTKTGWIILDSEPKGAAVYINDGFVGNTPLDGYKQPYGTYSYKVEKAKYHSATGSFELNSGRYENTIKLKPAFGSINVNSSVSGAAVLLDGNTTGKTTPCILSEIASGPHTITLQKDKYAPMQYSVTVEDGMEAKVSGNLDARFASVTINSLQGAEITIDGNRKGTTSYTTDLMEGYYDVEATLAHHRKSSRQLQVVAGQPQTVTLNPTPIYGSLDVLSTPRNATITIDGKQYGQTPNTIDDLLEGEHTVVLSLDGYATETKRVSISDGQTASLSATLQNGREVTISIKDPGAVIYIDGKEVGASPYTGSLSFGTHSVYAMLNGDKTSEQTIVSREGVGALPEVELSFLYVDLGLSVKWATCNIGASKPWDYGDYYAWGETSTKSTYYWSTYLDSPNRDDNSFTRYALDKKTQLDPQDDVAHVKWGGSWRMPTRAEQDELREKCNWTWTTQNGVNGYKVTSKKNGNSIFLPAAGYRGSSGLLGDAGSNGYYWSSSLNSGSSASAYYLYFNSGDVDWYGNYRCCGRSVRPVCP